MPFVDFEELKSRVSIEEAVKLLNLDMKPRGNQLRGQCPTCGGTDRGLVVTPSRGVYYCFMEQKGGDLISLAAHVRQESLKDAASFLTGTKVAKVTSTSTVNGRVPVPPEERREGSGVKSLDPLTNLESNHEAVSAIGLDSRIAAELGIGYRTKGAGQGSVMIPVRDQDGRTRGYVGVIELTYIPKDFMPLENVIKFTPKKAG